MTQSVAGSMKRGRGWDRTSKQGYLRSSDRYYGREGTNRKGEGYYELPAKNKLQDARKLQVSSKQRVKHEKLPVRLLYAL